MTTRYVLDTNIVTALLRYEAKSIEHTARAAAANAELLLCPVVFYEALRGLLHQDAHKQRQRLLDYATTCDRQRQAIVVTTNEKGFVLMGVQAVNWPTR